MSNEKVIVLCDNDLLPHACIEESSFDGCRSVYVRISAVFIL